MRFAIVLLAGAAVALAGCALPEQSSDGNVTPTPTPTPPTTPDASSPCIAFNVTATPREAPAGQPRELVSTLRNCGNETFHLSHACLRGVDLRIVTAANASYLVDNPIANLPLLCATAPPHVRDVAPGATWTYAVSWSGLYAPAGCGDASCARILPRGEYVVAAYAADDDTRELYTVGTKLVLT